MSAYAVREYYNSQIHISRNSVVAENVTAMHFGISIRELRDIIG